MSVQCGRRGCRRASRRGGYCDPCYAHIPHGYVDAKAATEHYAQLRSAGYTIGDMVRLTGVNHTTLWYIATGRNSGRIRRDTHDRIVRIAVPRRILNSEAHIPSVGTHRRLHALMAIGWRLTDIGAELGMSGQAVTSYLQRDTVQATSAVAVAELFNRWQLTPGPSDVARDRAQRKGWHPPLAWDEDTIDDPKAQPHRQTRHERQTTRFPERYLELRDHIGIRTPERIAELLGIEVESLNRQLARYREEIAS